jgi:hypothetical protein
MSPVRAVLALAIAVVVGVAACENTATFLDSGGPGVQASHGFGGTFAWEGLTWDVSSNGHAEETAEGHVVLTRNDAGNATLSVDQISGINATNTPWVALRYMDNAERVGVDLFVNATGPRMQAGSLFSFQALGFARVGSPPSREEEVVFAEPPRGVPGEDGLGGRHAGQEHVIYIGENSDGSLEYWFDGTWYESDFFIEKSEDFVEFTDILLRLRRADSSVDDPTASSAEFVGFASGADHPPVASPSDCRDDGWASVGFFESRGECLSFVNGRP